MEKSLINKPGVIALMQYDDGKSLEFSSGVESIQANSPIDRNSIFDIASLSKQFTAFCILLLEKKGELKLNSLLSHYIPEADVFKDDITIENLIYHTSGLPCLFDIAEEKGIDYFSQFSRDEIISGVFEQRHLHFTPGSKHEYSNTGYILLARIVENITGKSFADFVKQEVFRPIGMSHSFVFEGNSEKRAVSGYQKKENNVFAPVFSPWDVVGAGLVYSSASDLMKWGLNFCSGLVGGKELIKRMLTPLPALTEAGVMIEEYSPYCFGIERDEDASGEIYCHLGSTFGRESYFIRSQQKGFTLTVLSNIEEYDVSATALKLFNGMIAMNSQSKN
ncbi:serine hydrolase domain-containing protein [Pantoea sp. GD03673]|uniref:serine hydrolase domain-containing protein n=1 Tax=Pantoea sp. GD03673 TaxID=2975364 RepID=UPI0024494B01|nr:serine hydrolase domain-containing protein [Pantoea sp. GD03673]MDH2067207.1 beta-lactamase family protein [Pantoea sp. GD03673]